VVQLTDPEHGAAPPKHEPAAGQKFRLIGALQEENCVRFLVCGLGWERKGSDREERERRRG